MKQSNELFELEPETSDFHLKAIIDHKFVLHTKHKRQYQHTHHTSQMKQTNEEKAMRCCDRFKF